MSKSLALSPTRSESKRVERIEYYRDKNLWFTIFQPYCLKKVDPLLEKSLIQNNDSYVELMIIQVVVY